MEQLIAIIILGVVLVLLNVFGWWWLAKKQSASVPDQQELANFLKTDLVSLRTQVDSLKDTVHQSNLNMSDRLERGNTQMQSSMSKQLTESAKLVADVSNRLTKLDETNKRVVDVADELKSLQNVLQNPKQRGVFGEFYLESVLDNVLSATQYQMQYKFRDGETVDAVVFLDKGRILPVDSKFSLENYNRMIEATDKDARAAYLAKIKNDLKSRIDETAKYIRPAENTMDFAFMFIPSESLYYDLLINNVGTGGSSRDLIEYAFRDKRVIIVSPTSFLAYLQTVLQGLRSLQIEEQAKEIQKQVGKLDVHIRKFDDFLTRMGKSLSTTVGHYNNTYKELSKIDKDVVKIAGGESTIEVEAVSRPTLDD